MLGMIHQKSNRESFFNSIQAVPYDDHLILYHPVSNSLCALNETGKLIWEHYKSGIDARNIADHLIEQFSVSDDTAFNDVENCLSNLKQSGFLEPFTQTKDCKRQSITHETVKSDYSQVDKSNWYSIYCFSLAGITSRISFGDPEVEAILLPILAHLKVENTVSVHHSVKIWSESDKFIIIISGAVLTTKSLYEAVGWILYDLVDQICRNHDCMALLHGGAVKHGKSALILAGSKGKGKSTLIAALQHNGFEYLCDDLCPLEKNKRQLIPVPMSQRLKSGSWEALYSLYPSLANLRMYTDPDCQVKYLPPATGGSAIWNRHWPVSGLVFPVYSPETTLTLHHLKPLEVLSKLVHSKSLSNGCVRSLLAWLENLPSFVIRYSDFTEATDAILTIMDENNA